MICCCTSCTTSGYVAAGFTDAAFSIRTSATEKVCIATQVGSHPSSADLSTAIDGVMGAANPSVAGYWCGGINSTGVVATGEKMTFSNDTSSATSSANLSQARSVGAPLSERSTKAYFCGGQLGSPTFASVVTTDKLVFSTDTTAHQASADLPTAQRTEGSVTQGSTKGYVAGGFGPVATAYLLTYSTDSIAAQASANLSTARASMQCGSDGSSKGYFAGGQTSTFNGSSAYGDKIVFSTDTTSDVTGLHIVQTNGAGFSDGNIVLSLAGDVWSGTAEIPSASGNKLTFATDTAASIGFTVFSSNHEFPAGLAQTGL